MRPPPRDGGFFPLEEGERLKMAAASPWCWGRGAVSPFRRCSPAKPRCRHLGPAGRARCQRHKMAEEPRVKAGPRLTGPRGGEERQRPLGGFAWRLV